MYGYGDSLFYPSPCKQNPVYFKNNEIVSRTFDINPDTVLISESNNTLLNPNVNYEIIGNKNLCYNEPLKLMLSNQSKLNTKWIWNADTLNSNTLSVQPLLEIGNQKLKYVIYTNVGNNYCEKVDSVDFKINPAQKIKFNILGNRYICSDGILNLNFTESEPEDYTIKWIYKGDSLISNNLMLKLTTSGKNKILFEAFPNSKKGYCEYKDSLNVVLLDPLNSMKIIGSDSVCMCEKDLKYSIVSPNDSSTYTWEIAKLNFKKNTTVFNFNAPLNESSLLINVQETNKYGCTGPVTTSSIFIKPIDECLFIPNIITPNNDGKNDEFRVIGLDKFPENQLIIENRWGVNVFNTISYNNTWNAENCTDGVYFYQLNINNCKSYKNWIEVVR